LELSGFEMVVIFLIALLVLGPEALVKHAVSLGRLVGKARTQFNNFKVMTQEEFVRRAEVEKIKDLSEKIKKMGTEIESKAGESVDLFGARKTEFSPNSGLDHTDSVSSTIKTDSSVTLEAQLESQLLKLGASKDSGENK
jgi:Sec-independent protein translocase protein TatA